MRTGSSSGEFSGSRRWRRSEPHPAGHVLLPVLEAQEILPRELALSERRGTLEERDVDEPDVLGSGGLGNLLGDHLTHERDRNAAETVDDFFGAADARARQH